MKCKKKLYDATQMTFFTSESLVVCVKNCQFFVKINVSVLFCKNKN